MAVNGRTEQCANRAKAPVTLGGDTTGESRPARIPEADASRWPVYHYTAGRAAGKQRPDFAYFFGVSFLFDAGLTALALTGLVESPYLGLITFILLPMFFVAGLVLIPLGAVISKEKTEPGPPVFVIDFHQPKVRRAAALVIVLTVINVMAVSTVSYEAVHYTESVQFCGEVCHTVMKPEFTAHQVATHSNLQCVTCHVDPGLEGFIKAKMGGVRQLIGVATGEYPQPIPVPVHSLSAADVVCASCHEQDMSVGDELAVKTKYSEDEANTPLYTVLVNHIGKAGQKGGSGVHGWHLDPSRSVRFLYAGEDRQTISLVRVKEEDGTVRNYVNGDFEGDPAAVKDAELQSMDCYTCHNRPAHTFEMPGPALDEAMRAGAVPPDLPYIKQVGLEALNEAPEQEEQDGAQYIAEKIRGYYDENYPDLDEAQSRALEQAVAKIQGIYNENVFPEMQVTWGTYPRFDGHTGNAAPGCFRCHDDSHSTPDGEHVISQDCTACHTVQAWDEENPDILAALGLGN